MRLTCRVWGIKSLTTIAQGDRDEIEEPRRTTTAELDDQESGDDEDLNDYYLSGAQLRPGFGSCYGPIDYRVSGSVLVSVGRSVVEGAPTEEPRPDASNARSQQPAPEGNWCVSCSCLCVKHPWLPTGVLHCPGHPSCAGA
jgi:hypothetical protein